MTGLPARSLAALALGSCLVIACRDRPDEAKSASEATVATTARPLPDVSIHELPSRAGSSSPNLARGAEELHLAWMSQLEQPAVVVARLDLDGAGEWSEAEIVSSSPRLLVNWADVPAVAETPGGRVVVAWPEHHTDDPAAGYGVRVAAMSDDGSFGPAWSPDGVRRGPESGFVGFVAAPAGLRMFWLDGRELGEGARQMQLRSALIDEAGDQRGPSVVLDERTCECCKLDAGLVGEQAFAAYRDRSESEVRDIFVAGPELAPTLVARDGWTIAGCPVNGPAVAGAGTRAHVAWFSGAGERSVARIATLTGSLDAGFGPPARFDLGLPAGRVDLIAIPDGGALISWFELDADAPGRARLLTRRLGADGRLGDPYEVAAVGAARDWGFPRAARVGERVVWVFTDPAGADGRPRLEARIGPLPAGA